MRSYRPKKARRPSIIILASGLAVILATALIIRYRLPENSSRQAAQEAHKQTQDMESVANKNTPDGMVIKEVSKPEVIDYNELEKEGIIKDLMASRKKDLGMYDSLDMVVRSDETVTVGGITVSMQEILEQAAARQGKVFETQLTESGSRQPGKVTTYGVYVVQPGDNIWNIHFRILKEYYARKGIEVEDRADEPTDAGVSSGIGKILKFSESMVIIYNLKEKTVDDNINIIEPLSKVIIYNMEEVFSLLDKIDFNHVDRLQFDGTNIWIPIHN